MDKTLFWKLIDDARREVSPSDEIAETLIDRLASMEVADIMHWDNIFRAYQKLSYKTKLWAAAYAINGGCSDDGFDYFRGWLTAQGEDVFLRALADPESLAELDIEPDAAEYEDMLAVSCEAFFKKSGMEERDYGKFLAASREYTLSESEQQDLAAGIRYAPDIDMEWSEDDLETVVPILYAKYFQ